jgi:hypothetical protein
VTQATVELHARLSVRSALERRAKLLAWTGNGWHLVEFAVALGAGIAAGSVALVGFGLDSLIEVAAAGVVIWLFSGGRGSSHAAERRARNSSPQATRSSSPTSESKRCVIS